MAVTTKHFDRETAPCGQSVPGDRLKDRDEQCLLSDETFFACGCQRIRHEYHDGSVSSKVVHHDGTVLEDEIIAAQ